MKLYEKRLGYTHTVYQGRMKNCKVTIDRTSERTHWYFYLIRETDNFSYNSLWETKKYNSKEECLEQAKAWIKANA